MSALLQPTTVLSNFSLLILHIHSFPFSDWRRTVSQNCSTHRSPQYQQSWNRRSFMLNSYLSRIGKIGRSTRRACGHRPRALLVLHGPVTGSLRRSLFDVSSLNDLWSRLLCSAGSWGFMFFRHSSIPGKGRVTRTPNKPLLDARLTHAIFQEKRLLNLLTRKVRYVCVQLSVQPTVRSSVLQ